MSFLIMGEYITKDEVFHFPKGVKPMETEDCDKCNNINKITLTKDDAGYAAYIINKNSGDWCSCVEDKPSPRDTQFQGFAHLLLVEFIDNGCVALDWDKSFLDLEKIIARGAYDLVKHALNDIQYDSEEYIDSHVRKISDMIEWPDEVVE